jgi:hypothetical protein
VRRRYKGGEEKGKGGPRDKERDEPATGRQDKRASINGYRLAARVINENNKDPAASHLHRQPTNNSIPNHNYNNTLIMLVVLPTFLIFVSLSVAAIPLGPRPNGQTPHIRSGLPLLSDGLPNPADLLKGLPIPSPKILKRFIMGADYASSSGPFLGKSSHKRQDPLSGALGSTTTTLPNGLKEQFPPNLSPGSAPT